METFDRGIRYNGQVSSCYHRQDTLKQRKDLSHRGSMGTISKTVLQGSRRWTMKDKLQVRTVKKVRLNTSLVEETSPCVIVKHIEPNSIFGPGVVDF